MEILYIIIALVFGVLQLILFFKLFAMTSQISEIRKKIIEPSEIDIANQMYIVGNMKGVEAEVRKYIDKRIKSIDHQWGIYNYDHQTKIIREFIEKVESEFNIKIDDIDEIIAKNRPKQSNSNSNVNTIA